MVHSIARVLLCYAIAQYLLARVFHGRVPLFYGLPYNINMPYYLVFI